MRRLLLIAVLALPCVCAQSLWAGSLPGNARFFFCRSDYSDGQRDATRLITNPFNEMAGSTHVDSITWYSIRLTHITPPAEFHANVTSTVDPQPAILIHNWPPPCQQVEAQPSGLGESTGEIQVPHVTRAYFTREVRIFA